MYRQYEDPWMLEDRLKEAEEKLEESRRQYAETDNEADFDRMVWRMEDVESLRERANFAWQDQEYDELYMIENYGGEEAWV